MTIRADEPYRDVQEQFTAALEALGKGEHREARDGLLQLKPACRARGIRSAQLAWHLAIACDYLGEWQMAFESIREAVGLDPLAAPIWQSYRIVVERMRKALTDARRPAEDPEIGALYAALSAAGETTPGCHLAMARHLRTTARLADARRLAEAVTLLFPFEAAGWLELAACARAAGEHEAAGRAETEAASISGAPPIPFTTPARADA